MQLFHYASPHAAKRTLAVLAACHPAWDFECVPSPLASYAWRYLIRTRERHAAGTGQPGSWSFVQRRPLRVIQQAYDYRCSRAEQMAGA